MRKGVLKGLNVRTPGIYIGLQLNHCYSHLFSISLSLSATSAFIIQIKTKLCLSEGTNKMKKGAGLVVLNRAWTEAEKDKESYN